MTQPEPPEHLDFLIVGAGLSGIGAAYHFQRAFPTRSYAILEARNASGGTWDVFRYPGIRSDSDMFTLGYRFRPWTGEQPIAEGPRILDYLRDTAREHGIDERTRHHHEVLRAEWSSARSRWTVTARRTDSGQLVRLTTDFLMMCTGYYRYDRGHTPDFPGIDRYSGRVVHPQHWPEDLDYAGRRVVVIGSGATAMTLVPAMAPEAGQVTMLQRSPSYVLPRPSTDALAARMQRLLPRRLAYSLTRARYVATSVGFYEFCRRFPGPARRFIRRAQQGQLPEEFDHDLHLSPRYDPWDQRLCIVPDGDLFRAVRSGKVDVVTDTIESFTEEGVRLASGRELAADVVVTATGLDLLAFGGVRLTVDGEEVSLPRTMAYKGMMLGDVPNFACVVGYTNASWTLKAELVCEYVVRLLRHMAATGTGVCVPRRDPDMPEEPFLDFAAGYVLRSVGEFPRQGARRPWRLRMNYYRDLLALRYGPVVDGVMEFRPAASRASTGGDAVEGDEQEQARELSSRPA